jgi:flagellar hook-associated protein 1 FlgK
MIGTGGGPLELNQTQLVNAAVVNDGSGQRLQIQNTVDTPLQVTGTMAAQINLGASVAGEAQNIKVRTDIAANPSLLSQGTLQYDPQSGTYFAGQTDNSDTVAMANLLTNPVQIPSAGGLGQGQYSLTQYASNIVATTSVAASNNNTQLTYQKTLVQNLTTQKGALSGVSLDEELSNMITYQQAYTASARVISTMQQLFDVLNQVIQ